MTAIAGNGLTLLSLTGTQSTIRHPARVLHQRAESGTYAQPVPATANADPHVQLFARFIKRAIDDAVSDGMSIDDIEARTGVGRSTFYRWTRAESASPDRRKVEKFCAGLDIPISTAGKILGWGGSDEDDLELEEQKLDPDVVAVLRKLADPDTSPEQKSMIRQMLRSLAAIAGPSDDAARPRPKRRPRRSA